jgi:hypothetical protein
MKPWLASAGAVAAGFIVTAVASTAADAGSFTSIVRACVQNGPADLENFAHDENI